LPLILLRFEYSDFAGVIRSEYVILPVWILCLIFNLFTYFFNTIDIEINNRANANNNEPIVVVETMISPRIKLIKLQLLARGIQLSKKLLTFLY